MTEQELRKKIAQELCELNHYIWNHDKSTNEKYSLEANKILALIKEALPELAREAGWIDPAKVIMPGEFGTPKAEEALCQWVTANGYVKLADVQTLTEVPLKYYRNRHIWFEAQQELRDKASWRKVELEVKDE